MPKKIGTFLWATLQITRINFSSSFSTFWGFNLDTGGAGGYILGDGGFILGGVCGGGFILGSGRWWLVALGGDEWWWVYFGW